MPRTVVIMIWLALCLPQAQPVYSQTHEECVIVLHGMGRTRMSMGLIEDALTEEGYRVWNASYPSR
ncbi:MAG: alpha/beta hydrolase, partial [Gammaproteobacteria bacterium]